MDVIGHFALRWVGWSAFWFGVMMGSLLLMFAVGSSATFALSVIDGGWAYYDFAQATQDAALDGNLQLACLAVAPFCAIIGAWTVFQQ